jgi:hypothetical protein
VVLRPSKRRKAGSFLAGLWAGCMAAAGVAVLGQSAVGLLVAVPGAPLALYWLAVAMPRSCALTLDRTGFTVRHAWITRHWDWDQARGFGVRHIEYNAPGYSIDLVSFATPDPREQPGDALQELAIRGITRTTTLPDGYGEDPQRLAEAMSQCRKRLVDRHRPHDDAGVAADMARSAAVNAAGLTVITIVMTAGSLFLALAAGDTFDHVVGWIGVVLFGVGGTVALGLRLKRGGGGSPRAKEVDADVEIATTATSSGESKETVARVLDAHYAFLERQPRDRPIDVGIERTRIAAEAGLDEETVGRVLDAHDDFLAGAGLMEASDG